MGTLAFTCEDGQFGLGLTGSPHDEVSVSDMDDDAVRADFKTLSKIGLGMYASSSSSSAVATSTT